MGRQKVVRDEHGIPKGVTRYMAPEDMLNAVANLGLFNAEEHVTSTGSMKIGGCLPVGVNRRLKS